VELVASVVYHVFSARDNMSKLPEDETPPF
jgi:hypothetical protein